MKVKGLDLSLGKLIDSGPDFPGIRRKIDRKEPIIENEAYHIFNMNQVCLQKLAEIVLSASSESKIVTS